jgi:hypothetical protein
MKKRRQWKEDIEACLGMTLLKPLTQEEEEAF